MMTEHDASEHNIAAAAQKLQESFEEMSNLTTQLSDDMSEVVDGFQSFGEAAETTHPNQSTQVTTTSTHRSGFVAADD